MKQRPLSPHLQIYKFTWLMASSILHRITGVALAFGALLVTLTLLSLAAGPGYYYALTGLFNTVIGKLIFFGLTWALFQHLFGGLRHLLWDTGNGLSVKTARTLAISSAVLALLSTLAVWACVLNKLT